MQIILQKCRVIASNSMIDFFAMLSISKLVQSPQQVDASASLPVVSSPHLLYSQPSYLRLARRCAYLNLCVEMRAQADSAESQARRTLPPHRTSPLFVPSQARADDLRKAVHVVVTNCHGIVVASQALTPPGGAEHFTLTISLPDDLGGAPLALHRGVLVERLNAAFSRGADVLAWAINGPGCGQVEKHRKEFALCRRANEELVVFRPFLAVEEVASPTSFGDALEEVASPTSFGDALLTQMRILAEEVIKFRDPLSKQSSADSSNKETSNDRIERYISTVPPCARPCWDLTER